MNREEAIKWLKAIEKKYIHGGDEEYDNLRKIALHMAMESLKQSEPRWIPVSERVPEKKTEVVYSLDNHYVSTGYMTDRDYEGNIVELHWEDMESGALIYPEAWMPLPEPYKEDKDE